jgi:hypothetical protein
LELREDRPPRGCRWLHEALSRVSILRAVQCLTIYHGFFDFLVSIEYFAGLCVLQELKLFHCTFNFTTLVFDALSQCTSLKHLCLDNIVITYRCELVPSGPKPPPSLTCLEIGEMDHKTTVLEWLISGTQVPPINTLKLSLILEDETSAIAHCLKMLGPFLKNLSVAFPALWIVPSSEGKELFSYFHSDVCLIFQSRGILPRCRFKSQYRASFCPC